MILYSIFHLSSSLFKANCENGKIANIKLSHNKIHIVSSFLKYEKKILKSLNSYYYPILTNESLLLVSSDSVTILELSTKASIWQSGS